MKYKNIDALMGRAKKWENGVKDKDRDGVMNVLDCKPNNPKEQGVIHDLVRRYQDKKKEREVNRERKYYAEKSIREKEKAAYYREKERQAERVAKEKAKYDADKNIKYHKEGGFFGQLARGASTVGKTIAKATSPPKTIIATKKKKKKKKGNYIKEKPYNLFGSGGRSFMGGNGRY